MLRFVRGRHTGISSAAARNSRRHRIATRGVYTTHASAARTPNGFFRPLANAHAPFRPARKNTLFSFLSSHDSRRAPCLSFSAPPRALTRTRAHHAHLSQFQKKAFTSSPTSRISLLHSGLRVKTLLFFPSPLSSRGFTPKVKNFRRGFSPKTGTNREETGGSKTVKAKVKEKSKSLHP